MTVHGGDQSADNTLVGRLWMTGKVQANAFADHVGVQGLAVPDVDGAIATSGHEVVFRGTHGQSLHAALVTGDGFEEGETR